MENFVTFKSLIENLETISVGASFSIGNIVISMAIALIVALFIGFVYKKTFQGVLYSKSFNISLVIISLITTLIIMTISGNLVLSLGMVGALSIVRFRTAVKDPIDLVFMFRAISIGIANGVGFYKLSIVASIFIAITLYVLTKKVSFTKPYICVLKVDSKKIKECKQEIRNILKRKYSIRSIQYVGKQIEMVVEFRPQKHKEMGIVERLHNIDGIDAVHIVAYSGDVETVQ